MLECRFEYRHVVFSVFEPNMIFSRVYTNVDRLSTPQEKKQGISHSLSPWASDDLQTPDMTESLMLQFGMRKVPPIDGAG
jgi:hypothetical protein